MVQPAQSASPNPESAGLRTPLTGWQRRLNWIFFGGSMFFLLAAFLCVLGSEWEKRDQVFTLVGSQSLDREFQFVDRLANGH